MIMVLKLISTLLFDSTELMGIIPAALFMAGTWRLLQKSGLEGWWALIPGARDYQLARCAGREPEGRVYSLTGAASTLISVIWLFVDSGTTSVDVGTLDIAMVICQLMLGLVRFIYTVRVFGGLIEVYGVKRRWMWLCLLDITSWIPALIWGFHPKY